MLGGPSRGRSYRCQQPQAAQEPAASPAAGCIPVCSPVQAALLGRLHTDQRVRLTTLAAYVGHPQTQGRPRHAGACAARACGPAAVAASGVEGVQVFGTSSCTVQLPSTRCVSPQSCARSGGSRAGRGRAGDAGWRRRRRQRRRRPLGAAPGPADPSAAGRRPLRLHDPPQPAASAAEGLVGAKNPGSNTGGALQQRGRWCTPCRIAESR